MNCTVLYSFVQAGNVSEEEMRLVFNLGIGMILVVTPQRAEQILASADSTGGPIVKIGRTRRGRGRHLHLVSTRAPEGAGGGDALQLWLRSVPERTVLYSTVKEIRGV